MANDQPTTGAMKDISLPVQKKVWLKPEVEIISRDNIASGQAGPFNEATFVGISSYILYHS